MQQEKHMTVSRNKHFAHGNTDQPKLSETIFSLQEHNSAALFKKLKHEKKEKTSSEMNEEKKWQIVRSAKEDSKYRREAETTKLTRTVCSL